MSPRRRSRPLVQSFILGVAEEGPVTGYELRQTALLWEVADWAGFGVGSIYNAVTRLAAEGLVEEAGRERHGGYNPATVYAITAAGRRELVALVREGLVKLDDQNAADLALAFITCLPAAERRGLLGERLRLLRLRRDRVAAEHEHHLERPEDDPARTWPAALLERELRVIDVLLAWTEELMGRAPAWRPASAHFRDEGQRRWEKNRAERLRTAGSPTTSP
jgi:DNA-binding PadR family transcriptional regulator